MTKLVMPPPKEDTLLSGCAKCHCVFQYLKSDVLWGCDRGETYSYVICPNKGCGKWNYRSYNTNTTNRTSD
jgi:hypothetical protein